VTFSGGEPLHQLSALAGTVALLKRQKPELSVGMYTGYSLREANRGEIFHPLRIREHAKGTYQRFANIAWWESLMEKLDFAVMGRYNRLKPCSLPLRSSTNQKLHLFNSRYTEADFAPQQVEFNITSDLIEITGFPTKEIYANV
jgi:anaerobic ribonucleoside-triphosphate reductase activating protein